MIKQESHGSNLTNKYNPQELLISNWDNQTSSNLTNKYNPQEHTPEHTAERFGSNLTNKYNPQEPFSIHCCMYSVQILPINTILKNGFVYPPDGYVVQILPINTILKNMIMTAF